MGRKGKEVKQNQSSTQRKLTPTNPRVMRKKISVKKKKHFTKEQKTKEKLPEEPELPVKENDLETPNVSIDGAEQKTMESTPKPNVEDQGRQFTSHQ